MNAIEKAKDCIGMAIHLIDGRPELAKRYLQEALAALEAEKPAVDAVYVVRNIISHAFPNNIMPVRTADLKNASKVFQSYAKSYHKKECEKCKAQEDPNTFRRFEKRSGITTDVNDGGNS